MSVPYSCIRWQEQVGYAVFVGPQLGGIFNICVCVCVLCVRKSAIGVSRNCLVRKKAAARQFFR